jgi:hypothetical protein
VLFRWEDMDAQLLKLLMRIDDEVASMPLYMSGKLRVGCCGRGRL